MFKRFHPRKREGGVPVAGLSGSPCTESARTTCHVEFSPRRGGKADECLNGRHSGEIFSLNVEYTHVKGRDVCDNRAMATLNNGAVPNGCVGDAGEGVKAAGIRRVRSRSEATRTG